MASKQSIGERLHLLRLDLGWSAAECAYRLTLNSNDLIIPEAWSAWERAANNDLEMQTFLPYAHSVSQMFGIDEEWLLHGSTDERPTADVIKLMPQSGGGHDQEQ